MSHRVTEERSAMAAHARVISVLYYASIDRFLQLDISDADKRQILWDNCAATGIPRET